MTSRILVLAVTGLLALAACENKPTTETKPEEPTSKNSTTNATQPAAVAPAAPVFADGDLSTRADFEEAAEKAITKANYKAELASLETEIAKAE